jgi:hypothetical protein
MTDSNTRIEQLNAMAPDFIKLLGGSIIELDMDSQRAIFTFTVPLDYCHSGDVVQGGFVTAMSTPPCRTPCLAPTTRSRASRLSTLPRNLSESAADNSRCG